MSDIPTRLSKDRDKHNRNSIYCNPKESEHASLSVRFPFNVTRTNLKIEVLQSKNTPQIYKLNYESEIHTAYVTEKRR
jgi:hypothetical protein